MADDGPRPRGTPMSWYALCVFWVWMFIRILGGYEDHRLTAFSKLIILLSGGFSMLIILMRVAGKI